jgi:hypothetical protein
MLLIVYRKLYIHFIVIIEAIQWIQYYENVFDIPQEAQDIYCSLPQFTENLCALSRFCVLCVLYVVL